MYAIFHASLCTLSDTILGSMFGTYCLPLSDNWQRKGTRLKLESGLSDRKVVNRRIDLHVASEPLEEVSSFKYLGASFTATGQTIGEVKARINVARAAFNRLQPSLWSRPEISRRTKGRVYESVVRTILLYGCETWPLRVEDQRCLEVFDNDCLRRILGRRRRDRVPCEVLRHQLHLRALPPTLLQRRLRLVRTCGSPSCRRNQP